MANQQSHPNASNLLMILLMPQQVSPSINDDIYPGNKTTLQVPLGGPYPPSCRVWASVRCWDGYLREPDPPPPSHRRTRPHLGVVMVIAESLTPPSIELCPSLKCSGMAIGESFNPTPIPPKNSASLRCWDGYQREPA